MLARLQQVRIYVGKCQRAFVNEKGWKNLISTVLIIFLIISVLPEDMFLAYGSTRNGCFALICAGVWIGVFNSIQSVCRERDIIKREHRSGLHMSAYVIAHMLYELMLCFAEALIVTVVVAFAMRENLPAHGTILPVVLELFVTFFLLIYSSDILGLMISSIVRTSNTAMTVMPFVLIIELIMCGYIFPLSGFSEKLSFWTVSKWTLNALCTTADVNSMENYLPQYAIDYVHTSDHLLAMWGMLVAFTLLYGVIATVSLEFVDRDKRG
ncbi:MAG: ABC transporter permease [Mogibacterium sp.]|nr:ABC transporter permease [Mogibacterium sp.]